MSKIDTVNELFEKYGHELTRDEVRQALRTMRDLSRQRLMDLAAKFDLETFMALEIIMLEQTTRLLMEEPIPSEPADVYVAIDEMILRYAQE
jgi:hypothetical protein